MLRMQWGCADETIVDRPDYFTLPDYSLNGPVYPEGFESWSKTRADKYCECVKDHFESRRALLKTLVLRLAGDTSEHYGTEGYLRSLLPLFEEHISFYYVDLEKRLGDIPLHLLIKVDGPSRIPTYQTLSLSVDVAIVFADTIKMLCPRSEWIVFKRGKTFFNNNRLCVAFNGIPIAEPVSLGPQLLAREYRGDDNVGRMLKLKMDYYRKIFG